MVLEPRRLAARAAAARMASTLGEQVGERIGLRVRFDSKVSKRTRIEVVTEGVFTRLILDDPSLAGIAAVLFDEFHERSLDADLGLALGARRARGLARGPKIAGHVGDARRRAVAALLGDAPVIESQGRSFPVETRYLGRDARARIEKQVASAVERALRAEQGSLLVFLPGAGEIRRTETLLKERVHDATVDIVALYGALDAREQDRAIAPSPSGRRKVVLATSIAETSLTIEGVRVVIDSGLARVPRYEPDVGLTRLETVRVSRAAADQRRGRAGRTEFGRLLSFMGRAADRLARALYAAGDSFRRPVVLRARSGAMGRERSCNARLSRSAAVRLRSTRRAGCCVSWAPSTRTAASPRRADNLRQLPLPPRLARMVVDAPREGAGRKWLPRSPPSSRSAGWVATIPTCATAWISSAATARAAPKMRARWRKGGSLLSFRGAPKARTRNPRGHGANFWIPGPVLRTVPE